MILAKTINQVARKIIKKTEQRDRGEVPYWQIYSVLFAGALMVIMNQTAMKTALPTMVEDLNVSPSIGQWVVSGYTLVKGIMVPITAFAMTKFRTRNLYLLMVVMFAIGSLITATGINFPVVLFGALFQGVGAGMMIPLMQTVILTVTPPHKRGGALGLMGIILGFGPTLGPAMGGWIVDLFSWHFIFYFWVIGSLLVIPFSLLVLTDVLPNSDPTIDWVSIRHSLIGFGGLLYGFSVMGTEGFASYLAWIACFIGIVFIYLFIMRNLHAKEPMLNVRLFKVPTFTISVLILMLSLMVITGITNVMPMYIQTVAGRTATMSGLIVLPGGLLKAFLSPVSGKLYDKIGLGMLGPIGGFIMFVGCLGLVFVSEQTSNWLIILNYVIVAAGFGMFNVPVTTAGMNSLVDSQMGHGTSALQTVRQVGSSFAITLVFSTMSIVTVLTSPVSMTDATEVSRTDISMDGVRGGFAMVAVLAFLSFILTFFLKDTNRKKTNDKKESK